MTSYKTVIRTVKARGKKSKSTFVYSRIKHNKDGCCVQL